MSNFDRLATKINNQKGSKRKGQSYEVSKVGGQTVHTYADGKSVKLPKVGGSLVDHGITTAPRMNNVKGNPRQGSKYTTTVKGGSTFHNYAAEAGGLPAETFKVPKRKK